MGEKWDDWDVGSPKGFITSVHNYFSCPQIKINVGSTQKYLIDTKLILFYGV